jgi:hypothetical protein
MLTSIHGRHDVDDRHLKTCFFGEGALMSGS